MHLRYDIMVAYIDCNEKRHAQTVMRELGITYQHAKPQSLGDQWWFWNCKDVPAILPEYITELKLDPLKQVGWGLTKEQAALISANEDK